MNVIVENKIIGSGMGRNKKRSRTDGSETSPY